VSTTFSGFLSSLSYCAFSLKTSTTASPSLAFSESSFFGPKIPPNFPLCLGIICFSPFFSGSFFFSLLLRDKLNGVIDPRDSNP